MPNRRRLRDAVTEHRDALQDLQNEVNMREPDEIPAAARRERNAHHALEAARHDAWRSTSFRESRKERVPPEA